MSAAPREPVPLRDFLANERTFLAWMRTGVSLMGFGFVIAKFHYFLAKSDVVLHRPLDYKVGGVVLVLLGALTQARALWGFRKTSAELSAGTTNYNPGAAQSLGIAMTLASFGVLMFLLTSER